MAGTVAMVSFRFGGIDGVSRESDKWDTALRHLGWKVVKVGGAGPVDAHLPGLAIDAPEPPSAAEVGDALAQADVVVVENLCSLPLNPVAAAVVAGVLRGRPALLHHFDLPWQRDRFADAPPPPDDPAWAHVTINRLSARQLASRARITATTVYNAFDASVPVLSRRQSRSVLNLDPDRRLVLHPARAIPRKNIPLALQLAESLDAVYWLTGPAEEGYGPELDRLLRGAAVPVVHRSVDDMSLAYAACDVVAFPSTVEGFGNPVVESAVHRRPLAVGWYPVLDELAAFGFEWLPAGSPSVVGGWLDSPEEAMLARNAEVARRHFSLDGLPERIGRVFQRQGWSP